VEKDEEENCWKNTFFYIFSSIFHKKFRTFIFSVPLCAGFAGRERVFTSIGFIGISIWNSFLSIYQFMERADIATRPQTVSQLSLFHFVVFMYVCVCVRGYAFRKILYKGLLHLKNLL
jgi:hypothetical protein